MSLDRFKLLQRFIHLSDNTLDTKTNKIYKIQDFIDHCKFTWSYYYSPYDKICIDEAIIKYNGRLGFKQYIKDKPVKWGVKCFLICCCFSNYCLNIEIYTGKQENANNRKSPVEELVMKMSNSYLDEFRTIYADSYYVTLNLIKNLFLFKTGVIGTV